jgi:methylated-DNA-[protein]-cysteine S-methyltransferase
MKSGTVMDSPIGLLTIVQEEECLTEIRFGHDTNDLEQQKTPLLEQAVKELTEYFDGKRKAFTLPMAPHGTPFQQKCWNALLQIPYGETTTYGALAAALRAEGMSAAAQAVGGAVGRNPISIIIPCHRVLGSDSSLTGYAGGAEKKLWLLRHEGIL